MAIKKHKPTSPGRRFSTWLDRARGHALRAREVARQGQVALRRAQLARADHEPPPRRRAQSAGTAMIDFKRRKDGVPAKVAAIEYDPNRSAHIALLHYRDGEKRYILAPQRLTVGMEVMLRRGGRDPGRQLRFRSPRIPTGTVVHNVELTPGRGGQLGRSAGAAIQLAAKEGKHATLRLPSGEMRMVPAELPRDDRHDRQRRSRERLDRQGGAQPAQGHPAPDARHGDEPRRPPARRRRGQDDRRSPSGHALGRADARLPHAQEEQAIEQDSSCAAAAAGRRGRCQMGRSTKKGPWVEERLMKRIQQMNESGEKRIINTWSRASTVFPEMVGHTIGVHDGRRHVRSSSASRWSVTSSASSRRLARSAATPAPTGGQS